ncbi:caspase family protein, partial [Bradyrhizobium sp.]|uniref:caspase family protein n=1 Tax=Bradyrhizobium sp. TaxID=376 RepID=UPI003C71D875
KGLPLLSELGSNTFIVYATVPGETASDGTGRNSPFTAALLRHLETPGLEIQTMPIRLTHTPTRARLCVKRIVPHGRSRPQRPAISAIAS